MFKIKDDQTDSVIRLSLVKSTMSPSISLWGTLSNGETLILMDFLPDGTFQRIGGLAGIEGLQTEQLPNGSNVLKETI